MAKKRGVVSALKMRVLFVAPMSHSSGEAVTATYMAKTIVERGGASRLLATPLALSLLGETREIDTVQLTDDGARNHHLWSTTLQTFRPEIIVFADYPLLFFSSGVAPIADRERWVATLEETDALLVTLDHIGYAQGEASVFFGPPHLSLQSEKLPELPSAMHVLLPCPLNEPSYVPSRRGVPFRSADAPLQASTGRIAELRRRFLAREDELLIFHSVPNWSLRFAEAYGLPHYRFLPAILEHYLSQFPVPATVVSVNAGGLLEQPGAARTRFVNELNLPTDDYETLLMSADLFITENKVSTTLGKAVCGYVPSAVLKNSFGLRDVLERLKGPLREIALAMESAQPGSIFPYEVFPVWSTEDLDGLGLFRTNSINEAFSDLELWGGEDTQNVLHRLLTQRTRDELRAHQARYLEKVRSLPDAYEVLFALRNGAEAEVRASNDLARVHHSL
jgi:hypothetical protein